MNEVQYLYELDMPANMLAIVKKLPYRLRDQWRTKACAIQEVQKQRVTCSDIVCFLEMQVKIVTDPVFGNIQDTNAASSKGMNRTSSNFKIRMKGSSFATTVTSVETGTNSRTKERKPTTVKDH